MLEQRLLSCEEHVMDTSQKLKGEKINGEARIPKFHIFLREMKEKFEEKKRNLRNAAHLSEKQIVFSSLLCHKLWTS